MIRAVLDTNVLVSGLIVKLGPSARVINALREGQFLLIASEALLWEFSQAVRYPRIWKKYKLSENEVDSYLRALRLSSEIVYPTAISKVIIGDFSDNIILATALKGEANYVVSGDRHLLKLDIYKRIKILSPAEFVKILKKDS